MEIRISVAFGPRKEEDETDEREREKKNPPTLFVFFLRNLKKNPPPQKIATPKKSPNKKLSFVFFAFLHVGVLWMKTRKCVRERR